MEKCADWMRKAYSAIKQVSDFLSNTIERKLIELRGDIDAFNNRDTRSED